MYGETSKGHTTETVSSFFVKHKNWESLNQCLTVSQEKKNASSITDSLNELFLKNLSLV